MISILPESPGSSPADPTETARNVAGANAALAALFSALFLFFMYVYATEWVNWIEVLRLGETSTAKVESLSTRKGKGFRRWYADLRFMKQSGKEQIGERIQISETLWNKLKEAEEGNRTLEIVFARSGDTQLAPVVVEDLSHTKFVTISATVFFGLAAIGTLSWLIRSLQVLLNRKPKEE